MKTKSSRKCFLSIVLVLLMLLSLVPMSALAALDEEWQVTSTSFTLSGYGYGLPTASCMATSTKTGAATETYIYEQGICDAMNGVVTSDQYLNAGKQYYFMIRFNAHPDDTAGFADSFNPDEVPLLFNGVDCDFVECSLKNRSDDTEIFTSYYKLPMLEAIPVAIPFSKIVELGGEVAPDLGFFELEVANVASGSNCPITNYTIDNLSFFVEGQEPAQKYFTITHNNYGAILNLLDEGILVREKDDDAIGWENDDTVWCVMRHHDPSLNSLETEETTISVTLDYFKGKIVEFAFVTDSNSPATQMSFTNIYTENYTSVKIPFVKEVKQGGDVIPGEETFKLEIFDIGNGNADDYADVSYTAEVKTNGAGKFDGEIVFNGPAAQIDAMLCEGLFVREKQDTASGWSYSDAVWCVMPTYDEQQQKFYAIYPVTAEVYDDGIFYTPAEEPVEKMIFTNTYTENASVVTVKIPFVKKVTLGGNVAPTNGTFKFEIFDIGNGHAEDYADVSYTAEVTVNGKGEFEGEMIITGPEDQVNQMICEGFYVREIDGKAKNWKYSEDVWHIVPESVPVEDDGISFVPNLPAGAENQGQTAPEMMDILAIYPTTKTVVGDEVNYEDAAETAQKMIFENIYTENKVVDTPQTGDSSMMGLWTALLFVSVFGVVATTIIRKKRSVR